MNISIKLNTQIYHLHVTHQQTSCDTQEKYSDSIDYFFNQWRQENTLFILMTIRTATQYQGPMVMGGVARFITNEEFKSAE